ncbi:sigma 54-interacting transcriptional regulator [Pullulanibacillus sp. KACC 23026]|uniref:sigma-54 interaction domain-containing protein n=1 Tax=Pullulanibacillus sp. KACC 23026 TaxID=3028315 RepID=UPI0023B206E9|nr:sigma 54-interacting transcriptional regulator [Pullulanibacillus sp. KACC 23026]WEG12955.1 sigma 54-interacting transcriptional regulator [Pullulanibacillus sp. KACC 23026]
MIPFDLTLNAIALPWDETPSRKHLVTLSQETLLSALDPSMLCQDIALINSKGDYVGWIPHSLLTHTLYNLWQTTSHFYEALLQAVEDAVTVVDQNGIVLSWNKSAEKLYQCDQEEIIGKPITDFFKEESLMLMNTLKNGTIIEHQYNQSRSDVHVLVSTRPIEINKQQVGGLSVERNINDLVRLNEGLASQTAYIQALEQKIDTINANDPFHKIKGRSPELLSAITLAKKVARTDASVLINGESGVGKELFAQAIHKASSRAKKPFVDLNCGAIPASLFESELFGYEKGAFTGAAREGKQGKFDLAKGGTLFLDEIGELPLDLQVKLLRVLQERDYYRVGGTKAIPFDVRIIAATNRNLEEMISEGTFRQDLYYRLNVVSIQIPPLRSRIEDIPELVQLFVQEFSNKYHRPIPTIAPEVMYTFLHHPWGGNIRQLRNTIEHMIILADEDGIHPHHLPNNLLMNGRKSPTQPEALPIELAPQRGDLEELKTIQQALEKTYGNKSAAAKMLGISRVTLYNKIRKYKLN